MTANHVEAAKSEIANAMADHHRVVLQFSGGKDSLACLHLLCPFWDRLTVMWSHRGDPYPEVQALVDEIRPLVHEVVEIPGNAMDHAIHRGSRSICCRFAQLPLGG